MAKLISRAGRVLVTIVVPLIFASLVIYSTYLLTYANAQQTNKQTNKQTNV